MGQRILFVDDEPSILKSLERLFFDSDYEIFTAGSGEEGLQILTKYPVDIVMSDMRMPGMDGHQFLKTVKNQYPSTTRLILSGFADEREIINSLIDGSSNFYMLKPWDSKELSEKIAKVFETRQFFSKPALLDIANGLENLSLIMGLYNSVCRLIEQDAAFGAIARVIETDGAVTAAVLRIVNSACYNVKTGSVVQAITYLGLPAIKSIVLSCSISKSVNIQVLPLSIKRLNDHATMTHYYMAQIYAELLHKQLPDSLGAAGLLHNIGFVLCLHYFPDQYKRVMEEYLKSPQQSLPVLEQEFARVSHDELGGYLLNWWGIPYPIAECALFHHKPLHSAIINKEAVAAVHVANHYAWKTVVPSLARGLEEGVFPQLGIKQIDCERLFKARI